MTDTATAAAPGPGQRPEPDTLVPLNRALRPGTAESELSRFGDDRWILNPAIFEGQINAVSLNFALVLAVFRRIAKIYAWLELNYDRDLPILRRASINGRLAVYTMLQHMRNVRGFLDWLELRGIPSLGAVTAADLEAYLDSVRDAEIGHGARSDLLQAVRRLWAFRELLPAEGRLPDAPPWKGKDSRLLLGRRQRDRENRTPRIPEATMSMMLAWALRFVEDFSGDLLTGLEEFWPLFGRSVRCRSAPGETRSARIQWLTSHLDAVLEQFRSQDEPLPGTVLPDGSREPDWAHLGRLLAGDRAVVGDRGVWSC